MTIPGDAQLIEQIERVLKTAPGNYGYSTLRLALDRIANPPKDDELAQAYQQGYQDGQKSVTHMPDRRCAYNPDFLCSIGCLNQGRCTRPEAALQRPYSVAQGEPQPATKGE